MPVRVRRLPRSRKYRVYHNGVSAKATTKKKAQRQARLLRGVAHGWRPTGRKARR